MSENNKSIMFLTPFYPIPHRKDLFEDTKVVYYFIKHFPKKSTVLIVHTYFHRFRDAWLRLFEIFPIKKNYKNYLYLDDSGNEVFFLQNPLLIPKSIRNLKYINNRYINLIKNYLHEKNFNPKVLVVHFPSYYSDFLRQLSLNISSIAIIHSFDLKNIKKRRSLSFWKRYYENFDAIGYRSFKIKIEFEQLIGVPKKSFMCLSGLPNKFVDSGTTRISYNTNKEIKLIYAGRLIKRKNIMNSLRVLNMFNNKFNFSFTIVGEGEEKKRLRKFVQKNGLSKIVKFKGLLNRDETFKLMKKSDIFLMTSINETFGLVYLEAMAAGLIVVGSKGQGIDGIIKDGVNGFLVKPNNEEELYKVLYKVLTLSESEQRKIRDNARKTIEQLTDEKMSRDYYINICSVIDEAEIENEKN